MVEGSSLDSVIERLTRRLDRERRSRLEAETIAEMGLRALYDKQGEMELLERIAGAANQASSVREALTFAVDQICAYAGWPVGLAYVAGEGPSKTEMVPLPIRHVSGPEPLERFCLTAYDMTYPSSVDLPGRVAATARAAWITDLLRDDNFPRARIARQAGLRSGFAFPVLVGQDVVAVLEFFAEASTEIDESLLRLASHIGAHLGRVVERSRAEGLEHHAFHDALTKLPNRALFLDRLQRSISRSHRHSDYTFAVLFIDLDGFKSVNDSLGHAAGDQLIVEIAERLALSLRRDDWLRAGADIKGPKRSVGDDTLARLGGDEFTILVDELNDSTDAVRIAERIQQQLTAPFVLNGQEVFTTASIGITLNATARRSAEEMIRDADIAMYRAKALGKARCEVFDGAMHEHAVYRLKFETDLRRALERQEFRLQYQPIVSLEHGRIVGCEALLRWQRPCTGVVPPAEFIAVAEETGMILPLGRWVLREACEQAKRWQEQIPPNAPFTVAVNISARQFAQPDLVDQVRQTLVEARLPPSSLTLELTERVAMEDPERASVILSQLRALGVEASIDDFGTGYSSLSRLRHFPATMLKIDRSFTHHVHQDQANRAIVLTILTLARNLGMRVVAEGIETEEQARKLRSLDCDFGQGYFFSPAVDTEGLGPWLSGQRHPCFE